jgi:uncharacterized low-complexity protein
MKSRQTSGIALAVGGLVLGSMASVSGIAAASPFVAEEMSSGYQQSMAFGDHHGTADRSATKAEAKKEKAKSKKEKAKEMKCGEGKCGEEMRDKAEKKKDKAKEMKCGEGKCGAV